jgi:hypothetical protein
MSAGDQVRLDRGRVHALLVEHLGHHALPQAHLGGGTGGPHTGKKHNSNLKHLFKIFNSFKETNKKSLQKQQQQQHHTTTNNNIIIGSNMKKPQNLANGQ